MTTTHYKAIHPTTGNVCLRKSNRDCYRFAAIGPQGEKNASFSGSIEGAQNLISKYSTGWMVVPAVVITKEEFAAANKANKQFFKVKFMGKTYTASRSAGMRPYVCAVGYDRPEITVWHKVTLASEQEFAERIEWLRKLGHEDSIARETAVRAAGGYDYTHHAQRGVQWYESVENAQQDMARERNSEWEKATTYTLLDLA
jgi:hypothetical protein